jgi:class 3 adenylate cyclase/tetratricopeptide (TPR) repeat protein
MSTEAVVVLFTDVVGSTELSMAHSPERADEVRRTHFSILRQAVAETGGTEVKNLGDGLMVVFASASAAIACAVAMQQGVDLDNRTRERPVGLRVGLSGGEATREHGDYFGDPVIEAARLCASAVGGQILAADVVRLMAGRRNRHVCTTVGALELKGLPEPIETVSVQWEPLGGGRGSGATRFPGRLADRPDVGIVGRLHELRMLADAVRRVTTEEGREVVLVCGEAGLGKTTLVAEAARRAFDFGACVLFGHCEEDLVTPYQLFSESLGHFLAHAPEAELERHVAAHGAELCRLVPSLASRLPGLPPTRATDADSERFLLFAAVLGLLEQISAEQPLVVVLDDLQWADQGSLMLLRHLVASEQLNHVLVVGTYRDGELSPRHPLLDTLAALHRQIGVSRIELGGMDDTEVVALMEAAAGHTLEGSALLLAQAVHRETDGNAFFVAEVLRHLAETGAITQDADGQWIAEVPFDQIPLPNSLHEVIGSRVGRLGSKASRMLAVAAVIGRDFDLDLLSGATAASPDEVLDLLDAAINASLVRESTDHVGRYRFSHALVQHVLYADLGPTRQARLHRVVAEALEVLCADRPPARIGELARHWGATGLPGDGYKAVGYARQAGDAALRALAPSAALHSYQQAIERASTLESRDAAQEIDMGIGLGTAQRQVGDPSFRETLLDAARRAVALDDTTRLVVAALANSRGWYSASGTVDQDKVSILELALERLPAPTADRALVLATLCAELSFSGTLEQREALAEEAVAIAEASGDDSTVVRTLNHLVFPLLVPSHLERSLDWTAEALTRAERIGDPVLLYFAAMYRATVATRAGDVEEMDRCYAIAGDLARRLDQPSLNWEYTFHLAKRAQIAGLVDEAELLATQALQIGLDSGQPDAETFFGVQLAAVSWQRGTMGDLAPLIEQMVVDSPGLPTLKASLTLAYAEQDRLEDASRMLGQFAATGFHLPADTAWLNGMTEYAEAAIACGNPVFAEALADLLRPWADQFSSAGGVTAEGPVRLVLGGLATVLDRYDEAEEHFALSAAFSDRVGARFFGARTALLWGQMLAERGASGDRERAEALLEQALTAARDHGYLGIDRRAVATLAQL